MNECSMTQRSATAFLGVFTLAFTAANAQDTASSSAGWQSIEEIVVTARKREERLQDVPLTISVLTDDRLVAAGINDIQSLASFTPGFHFENVGNRQSTQPRFRGMDINTSVPTRQNASFFIDGIYMPGSVQGLDFGQFERIEVIKGPQSALFGRQTFGGAVNFVSKAPSDELTGQFTATAGSNSRREISGNLSLPLIAERLFVRGSVAYADHDGAFVDANDGTRLGAQESRSASLALTWVPVDSASVTLRYIRQEDDDGPDAILQVGADQLNCGPFGGTNRSTSSVRATVPFTVH